MDTLEDLKNASPLRSPSLASTRPADSSRTLRSSQSMSRSPTARSGRASPLPEMSITEQIARKTRKSTVLDQKNALMTLAIPDYDDYKIMQPYSCRSLSNKNKFVGGRDFITRHNPQEVNDFKLQYSRDVGNLNRHRSVLAPPNTLLTGLATSPPGSSRSFAFAASQAISLGNQLRDEGAEATRIWKRVYTTGKKPCWILTEHGINTLIGPEYSISARLMLTTAREETTPQTCRSPLRPHTPLDSFTARNSARIGMGVDLSDESSLGALSRTATYSPASRPPSPPRSPYRDPTTLTMSPPSSRDGHNSESARFSSRTEYRVASPYVELCSPTSRSSPVSPLRSRDIFRLDDSSPAQASTPVTLLPFAMELSPPCVVLDRLEVGEVYIFPVRVRNVGSRQERYRVKHMSASTGAYMASIAEATYDKESARLAPGLAAIITLTLSFAHRGQISGQLRVDTEGVGGCDVRIEGSVR